MLSFPNYSLLPLRQELARIEQAPHEVFKGFVALADFLEVSQTNLGLMFRGFA
jgi:hypothetical protein